MANCNQLFTDFNSKVRLTDARREKLINVREILRNKIRNYFIGSSSLSMPKFQSQGSFVMDTIINPIEGDYDLDDGIYFFGNLNKNQRPTTVTVHETIMRAIGDHTDNVVDKNACIRVIYSEGYHIDLPMYYAQYISSPDLAHKKKGWVLSNPVEFIAWFETRTNSGFQKEYLYEEKRFDEYRNWLDQIRKNDVQLRRIIRYLKAWGDFKKGEMPPGIVMTILGTENYFEDTRDDVAFLETMKAMKSKLDHEFACRRPTTPKGEDLFENYSETRKNYFLNALKSFIKSGEEAVENPNQKEACRKWQLHFGNRFSCNNAKDEIENATAFSSPSVIRGNAKSA